MNPRKSRKSLDEALAQHFTYGEKPQGIVKNPAPEQTPSKNSPEQPSRADSESIAVSSAEDTLVHVVEKISNKSTLIDKFQTTPKEATIRFTVDLPASMHRKLSILSAKTGKKKAEIVRMLLNEALNAVND